MVKPMIKKFDNIIEIINEYFLLILILFIPLFSDYVENIDFRYFLGWIFLFLCCGLIFLNLTILIIHLVKIIFKNIK